MLTDNDIVEGGIYILLEPGANAGHDGDKFGAKGQTVKCVIADGNGGSPRYEIISTRPGQPKTPFVLRPERLRRIG